MNIEDIYKTIESWEDDNKNNKFKALNLLRSMLPVKEKQYYLRLINKGYLTLYVNEVYNEEDDNYTKQYHLDTPSTKINHNTWHTNSLLIAATVKYTGIKNTYSDTILQPYHDYEPEDLEIVDEEGNVYNCKPFSIYTKYVIIDYIENHKNNEALKQAQSYYGLQDIKQIYIDAVDLYSLQMRIKNKQKLVSLGIYEEVSLDDLYSKRKKLVEQKGILVRQNKSTKKVQQQLDETNRKIILLGGR